MSGLIEQLDVKLTELLQEWNSTTTLLLLAIIGFAVWVVTEARDADTHPLLLARQAQASYVRQPGESAVFRSPEVPHGYPLKTGLQVKAPGTPAYAAGKDGDLRDVWRRVIGEIPLVSQTAAFFGSGSQPTQEPTSTQGKLLSVLGKDVEELDNGDLTLELNVIGWHLNIQKRKRVAVYLPNSPEFLSTVFAGAFWGFDVILIPYNQPHPSLINLLIETKADAVIAAAGALPLEEVSRAVKGLKEVIWVVEKTSRHVDWTDVPEVFGGKLDVSAWHELVQEKGFPNPDVLPENNKSRPGNIVFIWQDAANPQGEVVEFTQGNVVAAVGAAISALPAGQRLNPSDMFLPAESLTHSFAFVLTLAALFSHATVTLNSVAGTDVELDAATRSVSPTIIVASAESAAALHANTLSKITSGPKKLAHYLEGCALAAGRMPGVSLASRINVPTKAALGATPGKLRLLFVSERAGANAPPLTANDLSDLRIYTGARIAYALTSSKVCGAVAQTNVYDYRRSAESSQKHSHFGVPLSSVEVKLRDTAQHKTTDEKAVGEVIVSGPAVAGGETSLGLAGTFRDDHTLAYV